MQLSEKLLQIARLAGPVVLWVLIALSVLSIGIIVERWWWFARRKMDTRSVGAEILGALQDGGVEQARGILLQKRAAEAQIVADALEWFDNGTEPFREMLDKGLREKRDEIESGLLFLGTLGNNAPFVGLFGTVLGIVTAFRELGAATGGGGGSMNNVMGGIAEALIATAVGILVAIPAVVAYNVFSRRAGQVEENVGALGNVIVAFMTAARGAAEPHPHHRIGAGSGAEV